MHLVTSIFHGSYVLDEFMGSLILPTTSCGGLKTSELDLSAWPCGEMVPRLSTISVRVLLIRIPQHIVGRLKCSNIFPTTEHVSALSTLKCSFLEWFFLVTFSGVTRPA